MWPWGHLALGYLALSGLRRVQRRRIGGREVLWLALGTQLPDLVDKPLSWYVGGLPGRGLGHSALTAILLTLIVASVVGNPDGRDDGVAFLVGLWTHLLGDSVRPALADRYADLSFLLWPILPAPEYDAPTSVLGQLRRLTAMDLVATGVAVEVVLFVGVVSLWVADGLPGIDLHLRRGDGHEGADSERKR